MPLFTGGGAGGGRDDEDELGFISPFRGARTAERTRLLMRYLPRRDFTLQDLRTAAEDPETDDQQMFRQLRRTRGFGQAARFLRESNAQSSRDDGSALDLQRVWDGMSQRERRFLRQMGGQDPVLQRNIARARNRREDENEGGGGFWDRITDIAEGPLGVLTGRESVGEALGEATRYALPAAMPGGGPAMSLSMQARDAVQGGSGTRRYRRRASSIPASRGLSPTRR